MNADEALKLAVEAAEDEYKAIQTKIVDAAKSKALYVQISSISEPAVIRLRGFGYKVTQLSEDPNKGSWIVEFRNSKLPK